MLEIGKTSTLGVIVVCRECKHFVSHEADGYVWIDDNGDVYFVGVNPEDLVTFLFHHTGK